MFYPYINIASTRHYEDGYIVSMGYNVRGVSTGDKECGSTDDMN
jgi:hypothetical protein